MHSGERAPGPRSCPPGEEGTPEEILDDFDGLLLVGGGDIDPARYGGGSNEHLYGIEPDRDEFEIRLLRAADRISIPTLCICRGMQVMNVAFGGTLHQHLPDVPGLIQHGVPVEGTQTIHDVTPNPAVVWRPSPSPARSQPRPIIIRASIASATASR